MINIGLSSWVIMILLCILNYTRIVLAKYNLMFTCSKPEDIGGDNMTSIESGGFSVLNDYYSEDEDGGSSTRNLSSLSHNCSLMHLQIFLVCGASIALYVFSLFMIGRFYLQRLVARAGVTDTGDYYKFLMLEESITLKQATSRKIFLF
jgi:hypothetical protein